MKCSKCGSEIIDNLEYCTNCGSKIKNDTENQATYTPITLINPIEQKLLTVFKDKLFLCICILLSVSVFVQTIFYSDFSILEILLTIFLWIIYSSAQKEKVNFDMMRCVSGTLFAEKIILIVVAVLLFICGMILVFVGNVVDYIISTIFNNSASFPYNFDAIFPEGTPTASITIILIIASIILLIAIIIAIIRTHQIHKFAKELYESENTATYSTKTANSAKNWILVDVVLCSLTIFSELLTLSLSLGNCLNLAINIVAYILIKKHLVDSTSAYY